MHNPRSQLQKDEDALIAYSVSSCNFVGSYRKVKLTYGKQRNENAGSSEDSDCIYNGLIFIKLKMAKSSRPTNNVKYDYHDNKQTCRFTYFSHTATNQRWQIIKKSPKKESSVLLQNPVFAFLYNVFHD